MTRRRIAAAIAAAAALVPAAVALGEDNVPIISDVHAHPKTFCSSRYDSCAHPGTRVSFSISTAAKVRGDIRPRFEYRGPLVLFVRRFPQGANSVRIDDARLKKGTWVLRLQGTNSVGTGPIKLIHLHVRRHD